MATPRLIVLFDATCTVCTNWSRRLRVWDRQQRLQIRSLYESELLARYGINPEHARRRLHVVAHADGTAQGAVFQGIDAVTAIAKVLPVLWPLLPLLWTSRWLGIGQYCYDLVATRRYRRKLR